MRISPYLNLLKFLSLSACLHLHSCIAAFSSVSRIVTASRCLQTDGSQTAHSTFLMASNNNNGGKSNNPKEDQPNSERGSRNTSGNGNTPTNWESLYVRIARMRLEEENKRRFLKSRPAKLPYAQCKQWVKAQNMWHSKEEWYEWVNLGESLSAYIPSDPEAYFSRQGTWISWEDYLGC
jgi:hypothetical protein